MENINAIRNDTSQLIDRSLITEQTTLGELISILGPVMKLGKAPKAKMLREETGDPIAEEERVKVYRNGYAVYNNGTGYTVVWVPSCVSFTYHFDKMKDSEIGGDLKETCDLPEGLLETLPWAIAITLIGDHRIEILSMQRKGDRKQNKSLIRGDNEEHDAMENMDEQEDFLQKGYTWREDQFGEGPETVYLRKETREKMLASMTEKQREVFILYYQYGYTQQEIANMIGIAKQSVNDRLNSAVSKVKRLI